MSTHRRSWLINLALVTSVGSGACYQGAEPEAFDPEGEATAGATTSPRRPRSRCARARRPMTCPGRGCCVG